MSFFYLLTSGGRTRRLRLKKSFWRWWKIGDNYDADQEIGNNYAAHQKIGDNFNDADQNRSQ